MGIVGQDPSDSKSNQLHVDIFRACFHSFEVILQKSRTSTGYFSNSTGSSGTKCQFSASPGPSDHET